LPDPLKSRIGRTIRKLAAKPAPAANDPNAIGDYVIGLPTAQNAVDCLPGWTIAFPDTAGVKAGEAARPDESVIRAGVEAIGGVAGRCVLVIGPAEGWLTVWLDAQRPQIFDALEEDRLAFLRCLVMKEVEQLGRVRFRLGDPVAWLSMETNGYDLIVLPKQYAGLAEAAGPRTLNLLVLAPEVATPAGFARDAEFPAGAALFRRN
jgi:hypothetical protein